MPRVSQSRLSPAPRRRFAPVLAAGAGLAVSLPALALDGVPVGARGQGMAGANTASADDTTAQYYNPAVFGLFGEQAAGGGQLAADNNNLGRKGWGWDTDLGAGYRFNGRMADYMDRLAGADLDRFDSIDSRAEAEDLAVLVHDLGGVDNPGNAFSVDANAATALRIGHWGIGVRGMAQASGYVREGDLDTENFGFTLDSSSTDEIKNHAENSQRDVLTQGQYDQLEDAYDADTADAVDDLLAGSETEISQENLDQAVDMLVNAESSTGEDNQTRITFSGFTLMEVPLSYGRALNEHWAVGGNLKLMRGRVYGNQVRIFDDEADDVITQTEERYEQTTTFGVDLGVMGRWEHFQAGLTGRNLNAPTFDGFRDPESNYRFDDVTLDPHFRAGLAYIPFNTLTLEVDYDLTAQETALPGYETQYAAVGLEWDAWRFLALRAGAYENTAEDDVGTVYTAGLGLNLWAARLDIGGAVASEETTVDGETLPRAARVSAELSVDF